MNLILFFLTALGLAMDSCFISITKSIAVKLTVKQALIIAVSFGGFEALMTVLGWFAGVPLVSLVSTLAPWIAFVLISIVGIKMIYEAFQDDEDDNDTFKLTEIFFLAFSISIDAFLVGISFAILNNPIIQPAVIIGFTSFSLSLIGSYLGRRLSHLFGKEIEVIGGVILILIGLSFLLT